MKRFEYPVLLKPAAEGGYVVTCRDLPALITQGDSREDALAQAGDAMEEGFATLMKLSTRQAARNRRKGSTPPSGPALSVEAASNCGSSRVARKATSD